MNIENIFNLASMTFQMFGVEQANSLPELMNDMYNVQEELNEFGTAVAKLDNGSWDNDETRAEMVDAVLDGIVFMMQASVRWAPMMAPTSFLVSLAGPFIKSLGYNFEESILSVIRSQRTKLCFKKDDLNDTLAFYNNAGVECKHEFVTAELDGLECSYWLVKSSKMQFVGGKEYSENKVLKNVNTFKPPILVKLEK